MVKRYYIVGFSVGLIWGGGGYHDISSFPWGKIYDIINLPGGCYYNHLLYRGKREKGTKQHRHTLGVKLQWTGVSPGGVNDSHPLSTTKTGDKHQPHAPHDREKNVFITIYLINFLYSRSHFILSIIFIATSLIQDVSGAYGCDSLHMID